MGARTIKAGVRGLWRQHTNLRRRISKCQGDLLTSSDKVDLIEATDEMSLSGVSHFVGVGVNLLTPRKNSRFDGAIDNLRTFFSRCIFLRNRGQEYNICAFWT